MGAGFGAGAFAVTLSLDFAPGRAVELRAWRRVGERWPPAIVIRMKCAPARRSQGGNAWIPTIGRSPVAVPAGVASGVVARPTVDKKGDSLTIRIGTSGFLYEHWRGRFYPPSTRGSELEWYAARFDTVELNVTFYRMPSSATFRSWAARVPDGFLFAIKASRYLTHVMRLRDPRDPVAFLMERARELGPHLGPICCSCLRTCRSILVG